MMRCFSHDLQLFNFCPKLLPNILVFVGYWLYFLFKTFTLYFVLNQVLVVVKEIVAFG